MIESADASLPRHSTALGQAAWLLIREHVEGLQREAFAVDVGVRDAVSPQRDQHGRIRITVTIDWFVHVAAAGAIAGWWRSQQPQRGN